MKTILVTGSAGFIGCHLTKKPLDQGNYILGIDNINDYYDVELKYLRLAKTGIYKEHIQECNELRSNPSKSNNNEATYNIFNISKSKPSSLLKFIEVIEESLEIKTKKTFYEYS